MDAVIGFFSCSILLVVGVIGLIRPEIVKLASRWQAAVVLSGFIPVMGIFMTLFPGNPQSPQTPESVRQAGIVLSCLWLLIIGTIWSVRALINRSNQNLPEAPKPPLARIVAISDESQPSIVIDTPSSTPKVSLIRSISTAFDSTLQQQVVADIKTSPNVAAIDESALANKHHIPPSLVKSLVEKARVELLEVYLNEKLATRALDQSSAHTHSLNLGLKEKDFKRNWDRFRKEEAKAFLRRILTDGQITPEEAADLTIVRQILQADYSSQTSAIEEARKMWIVCNAPLEEVDAPLMMKRGEMCYGWDVTGAFEIRTRTKAISYGGPSLRIPIAKGFSFRVGHSRIAQHKEEHQHSFGTGEFCVTNTRLLWSGPNRTFNIPYNKIVNIDPFSDGITIYKDTGKPLSFDYGGQNKALSALILRVADEAG